MQVLAKCEHCSNTQYAEFTSSGGEAAINAAIAAPSSTWGERIIIRLVSHRSGFSATQTPSYIKLNVHSNWFPSGSRPHYRYHKLFFYQ